MYEDIKECLEIAVDGCDCIDVGIGAAEAYGITNYRLRKILKEMVDTGNFKIFYIHVKQENSNLRTTVKLLAPASTTYQELYSRFEDAS